MKKFIKENNGKQTGKIDILDIKYSQDESNNYYNFVIKTELPLQNASEYVRTIVENVLKSEKVRPYISNAEELEKIEEKIDYHKTDDFEKNINKELEKIDNVNISNFQHGYGRQQYIYNKSYYNHYKDYIHLQTDFSKDLDGNIKISITIDPIYNKHAKDLSFTLDGDFTEKDVALELYNLVNKYLEQLYLADKHFALKFEKVDLEMLHNKYPDDDYLKSLVGMKKFNILENVIRSYNPIINKNFINEVEAEFYGTKINGLSQYGEGVYLLRNDSYETAVDNHLFVEFFENNDEIRLSFDTNSYLQPLEYNFSEECSPFMVAQKLLEFLDERLEQLYLHDKNLAQHFDKADIEMLYKKYPNDNLLKSLASGNKYKLFDYYNFKLKKDDLSKRK